MAAFGINNKSGLISFIFISSSNKARIAALEKRAQQINNRS